MMNLCKLLSSRCHDILITLVVTEEWLSFIRSETKPTNIRFVLIPKGISSLLVHATSMLAYVNAISTSLEGPFEQLLDRLEPPATTIIADTFLPHTVAVGNRRNIPVASVWPMSAMVLSGHHSGISSTRIPGLPPVRHGDRNNKEILQLIHGLFPWVLKAQYLLLSSIYELEAQAIDALKETFPFPVYPTASAIPYLKFGDNSSVTTSQNDHSYLHWLDSQPRSSVLYISFGSYLSASSTQMNEIAAGLRNSGVRYLWVTRDDTPRFQESCGDMGMVVTWCDQLKVLCHSSVGGFWSHCGWNSTLEGVFAGVPFLTFPLITDQDLNSKLIVEDWKIGWRVKNEVNQETLVKRAKITGVVQRFMDLESEEGKSMRGKAKELQGICEQAIQKGGSSETYLDAFILDISKGHDG